MDYSFNFKKICTRVVVMVGHWQRKEGGERTRYSLIEDEGATPTNNIIMARHPPGMSEKNVVPILKALTR